MKKKVLFCIENPLFGDERKEVSPENLVVEAKKSLDLGMFGVVKKEDGSSELITQKMNEEELSKKMEEAEEVSMHKKQKEG